MEQHCLDETIVGGGGIAHKNKNPTRFFKTSSNLPKCMVGLRGRSMSQMRLTGLQLAWYVRNSYLLGVLHALLLGRAARRACQELGAWVDSGERCRGNFLRAHGVLQGARPWKPGWPAAGTSAGFAPKQRGAISQVGLRMLSHHGNTDKPVGFIKRQKGKADTHVTGVNKHGRVSNTFTPALIHALIRTWPYTHNHARTRTQARALHARALHARMRIYIYRNLHILFYKHHITPRHTTSHHITLHHTTWHDIT